MAKKLFLGVLMVSVIACAPTSRVSNETVMTAERLIDSLRSAGFRIESRGSIEQPFFTVPGKVYGVDTNDLQIYEYADASAAKRDAAKVSPDGAIGTSMPMWIAPPHFFHRDRLIVIYLGTSEKILEALRQDLGPEFAGAK